MIDNLVSLGLGLCLLLGLWYAVSRLPDRMDERASRRPRPAGPPIELLAERLCRLASELQDLDTDRVAGKAHHVRALQLAYDDTLLECLRALRPDDAVPTVPMDPPDRVEVELTLTGAGLRW